MWQNNIKSAFRQILKNKGFSFLNVLGLSTGLAICFLLFLWIQNERSYDQFHENADQIYRFQWDAKYGENSWVTTRVPVPLAETMVREFPEVLKTTQVFDGRFTVELDNEFVRENRVLFVDKEFFDVFTIETVAGEAVQSIQDLNAVVLTTASADRYFSNPTDYQSVIGKTIKQNDGSFMQVAGVVKSFPGQSHLQFDFLAPLKKLPRIEQRKGSWGSATVMTYALLDKQAQVDALQTKIQQYVDTNISDEEFRASGNYTSFPMEPITGIHLEPNITYLWMFGIVGVFIQFLACINFINLATARAMTRAQEVGVRKVLGSSRFQLMKQFFTESFMLVLFSGLIAVSLANLVLPYFNQLAGTNLTLNFTEVPYVWWMLFALILFTALATGAIPAGVLSSFTPMRVIKGQLTKRRGRDYLRRSLVVFQFCISSGLIIGTLVVQNQLQYLQNHDLGFDKEQVLIVRRASALGNNYQVFLNKLRSIAGVKTVSSSQFLPGDDFDSTIFVPEQPANYENTSLSYTHIDMQFAEALGLEFVDGRDFNPQLSMDSSGYLINEKAAEKLGWQEPVGKILSYGGFREGPVIGVVKDFNFTSLHEDIEPLILRMGAFNLSNVFIRLEKGNLRDQVAAVESAWTDIGSNSPFEFTFLDSEIDQLYEREQRMSSIFTIFSVLAVIIACLGLIGLVTFMAEQRSKEIGIRKVLGASVGSIFTMLSSDFMKLIFISLILISPLAYYFLDQWLQEFAYRTPIHWWLFVVAGVIAIGIALIAVSVQSLRAAYINPVVALRDE